MHPAFGVHGTYSHPVTKQFTNSRDDRRCFLWNYASGGSLISDQIRCPHCGVAIPTRLVATRNRYYCPCCRSELEVAPSHSLPILLVSLTLAIRICFALGSGGFVLVAGIAAATAIFYLLGGFVRTLVATPKLRARAGSTLPPSAKRLHARH